MEQAIKIAIENGWDRKENWFFEGVNDNFIPKMVCYDYEKRALFLLDPLFWQALGKGLGWGDEMVLIDEKGHPKEWCYFSHCYECGEVVAGELQECPNECKTENAPVEAWLYEWHRFIDHLAEGKDSNSFFEELQK